MKTVDQHLNDLLTLAKPLTPLELPLLDAQGSVLAEDLVRANGDVVLAAGTRLYSIHTGLAAAAGCERLLVRPHPRVVVLAVGDELAEPGSTLNEGQIFDANSWFLTAAAREAGAVAFRVVAVPDDMEKLTQVIEDQLVRADLVITSGGVSSTDVITKVLHDLGTVTFTDIAMEPGSFQGFGTIGPDSTAVIALPGEPVSAYVSFEVLVRPVIRQMLGLEKIHRPMVRATLKGSVTTAQDRRNYVLASLTVEDGKYVVNPVNQQNFSGMVAANAFIVADDAHHAAGSAVSVMMLERQV